MLVVKAICEGCSKGTIVDAECIFDTEAAKSCLNEYGWTTEGDTHLCDRCTKKKENQ